MPPRAPRREKRTPYQIRGKFFDPFRNRSAMLTTYGTHQHRTFPSLKRNRASTQSGCFFLSPGSAAPLSSNSTRPYRSASEPYRPKPPSSTSPLTHFTITAKFTPRFARSTPFDPSPRLAARPRNTRTDQTPYTKGQTLRVSPFMYGPSRAQTYRYRFYGQCAPSGTSIKRNRALTAC